MKDNDMNEQLIRVGSLVNMQGIRGEVRVISHTDFPEKRFAKGANLLLVHPDLPRTVQLVIETSRPHKNFYLLRFIDHPTINDVQKYKGGELKIPASELEALTEGSNYIFQLLGCQVETEDGQPLGELVDVLQPGANDVYVVRPPKGKDLLLPAIPECVKEVDVEHKVIRVHLMEGLIE